MQTPGGTDEQGLLTPERIGQIAQFDPKIATDLLAHIQTVSLQNINLKDKQIAEGRRWEEAYVSAAQEAMQKGIPQDEAQKIGLKARMAAIEESDKSGTARALGISPALIETAKQQQRTLDETRSLIIAHGGKIPEVIATSPLGKLEADYKMGRISESDYQQEKNKITAPTAAHYINTEKGILAIDRPGATPRILRDAQGNPIIPASESTPEAKAATAKLLAEYRIPPLTGFVLKTPAGQDIMRQVMVQNPNYQGQLYPTIQKTLGAFASGREGAQVKSFNVAIDHLDTLDKLSDALQNGNLRMINAAAQEVSKSTGAAPPTNFDAAKSILSAEIVKAITASPAGGGQTERLQFAAQDLSKASSPAQLKGVIKTVQTLMAGQLKGLKQQYSAGLAGMPNPGADFEEKFLLPRSKEIFNKMQQNPGENAPAGFSAEKEKRYQELLKKRQAEGK